MSENAVAFLFGFPSTDHANECSEAINVSLTSRLRSLQSCPPFASLLAEHLDSPGIELLVAGTSDDKGELYLFFDGSQNDVRQLFAVVKRFQGKIRSANCRSTSFNAQVLNLAQQAAIAPGYAVMTVPGAHGTGKKKWWQFWK